MEVLLDELVYALQRPREAASLARPLARNPLVWLVCGSCAALAAAGVIGTLAVVLGGNTFCRLVDDDINKPCCGKDYTYPRPLDATLRRCPASLGSSCCDRPLADAGSLAFPAAYTAADWPWLWQAAQRMARSDGIWDDGSADRWAREFADRLPAALLQPHDAVAELPRHDTCALVGSNGRLALSRHGAEIDAHDAVFRMNYAPVDGHQVHVGSRTDYRFVSAKLLETLRRGHFPSNGSSDRIATLYLCLLPWGRVDTLANAARVAELLAGSEHGNQQQQRALQTRLILLSWRLAGLFMCQQQDMVGGTASLSTGLHALAVASLLCNRVSLYGFGFLEPLHCHHYYDMMDNGLEWGPSGNCTAQYELMNGGIGTHHRWNAELEFLQRLGSESACVDFVV